MNWPVVLLAGGLAKRLRPITESIPKLLVEVAGEPFFNHQIRLLKKSGLTKIILCVGYLGGMIEEHYGDGSKWGVELEYSFDGPKLLGTGGAILQAMPRLGEMFYVLYGDSYLPIDYQAIAEKFSQSDKQGLMTVYNNQGLYDTSNVWYKNGNILAYDKIDRVPQMHHIDYGFNVFRASAFNKYALCKALDLSTVQKDLVAQKELMGYQVQERFYEIGSPQGLQELDDLLKLH